MNYSVREISLANEVDKLEKDLQQLKAAQYQGFDIGAIKETTLASTYDFSLASGASPLVRYFKFTSDKQEGISGSFVVHVTKGGLVTPALDADFDFTLQDLTHYQTNPRVIEYMSNIYNLSASTLYYKIYFYGTDTGTIEVTS
jgi:hypothetical protein